MATRRVSRRSRGKPVLALPDGVVAITPRGRTYFYYTPGRGGQNQGKRVRLPDDPHSPAFWQAYREFSGHEGATPIAAKAGTFDALIDAYLVSPEFLKKAASTQALNRHYLGIIRDVWGDLRADGVRPKHVLDFRDKFADTPRKADELVSTLRTIFAWGRPRELAGETNPAIDIGKLSGGDGWAAWQADDIAYARQHLRLDLWHAAALALYTGQRQGDVLKMQWNAIRDGRITVRQDKTGKPLTIPLHRDLVTILDQIDRRSIRILVNRRGKPWSTGFRSAWQDAMNADAFADFRARRLVFHGLRKTAVNFLLEAGATVPQTAAVTGQSHQMVAHYAKGVDQGKLASAAILKWEGKNGA
jgi:integrase